MDGESLQKEDKRGVEKEKANMGLLESQDSERKEEGERRMKREGLSADCKLDPLIVMAILMEGREHPCDRCNIDRAECRGYPRKDGVEASFSLAKQEDGDEEVPLGI